MLSQTLHHGQAYLDHGGEDGGPERPEVLQEMLDHSDNRMVGKYALGCATPGCGLQRR